MEQYVFLFESTFESILWFSSDISHLHVNHTVLSNVLSSVKRVISISFHIFMFVKIILHVLLFEGGQRDNLSAQVCSLSLLICLQPSLISV